MPENNEEVIQSYESGKYDPKVLETYTKPTEPVTDDIELEYLKRDAESALNSLKPMVATSQPGLVVGYDFNPDRYLKHAKKLTAETLSTPTTEYLPGDIYVVWFSKTLKNWKALCSSQISDGLYVELTYNGETEETYVDVYKKLSNTVVKGQA